MKTIGKFKLTQLSKAELKAKQMNILKGGRDGCQCGCAGTCSCSPSEIKSGLFQINQDLETDTNANSNFIDYERFKEYGD